MRRYARSVAAPRVYRATGIVLARFDLGEADRVLTILSPEHGKIRAIAKGVRRPGSRIGGAVEPFAELDLLLSRGRTFEIVSQVAVLHAWLDLRDRLESTATAWYVGELADRAVEDRVEAGPVYAILRHAFELLDAALPPGRVARWAETELADALGMRPEVERCVECDRPLDAEGTFRWAAVLGGVLCDRHPAPPGAAAVPLSLDALKLLRAYRRLDPEAIAGLRIPAATEAEVERAMRAFIRHVLERDPRALGFLDEVRATDRATRERQRDTGNI